MSERDTPTPDELAYLRCFGPKTHGLSIPRALARDMEDRGWVEWLPPMFGTTLYAITEGGRAALAKASPSTAPETRE